MRAADALDRQTASLQPSGGLGFAFTSRSRSSSLPLYDFSDEFQDSTPFYVFGVRSCDRNAKFEGNTEGRSDPRTAAVAIAQSGTIFKRCISTWCTCVTHKKKIQSSVALERHTSLQPPRNLAEIANTTPLSETFSLHSADHIVYGEASVLDMRHSLVRSPVPRTKSLDRIYPSSPKYRDPCIPSESWLLGPDTPGVVHSDTTFLASNEAHASPKSIEYLCRQTSKDFNQFSAVDDQNQAGTYGQEEEELYQYRKYAQGQEI